MVKSSLPGHVEEFFTGRNQVWKNRKDPKVEDLWIATLFAVELYALVLRRQIVVWGLRPGGSP